MAISRSVIVVHVVDRHTGLASYIRRKPSDSRSTWCDLSLSADTTLWKDTWWVLNFGRTYTFWAFRASVDISLHNVMNTVFPLFDCLEFERLDDGGHGHTANPP
jgi:hypothetical protein